MDTVSYSGFEAQPHTYVGYCSTRRIRTWKTSWTPPWTSAPPPTLPPRPFSRSTTPRQRTQAHPVVSSGLRCSRICPHPSLDRTSSDRIGSPLRTNASSSGQRPEPRTVPRHTRQGAHSSARQRFLGIHGPWHRLPGNNGPVLSSWRVLTPCSA